MNEEVAGLLGEIRDLLRPVASHYLVEYQQRREKTEKLRSVIKNSEKRERVCDALLQGMRNQMEIADVAGVSQPAVSGVVASLEEAGLATRADGTMDTLEVLFTPEDFLFFRLTKDREL